MERAGLAARLTSAARTRRDAMGSDEDADLMDEAAARLAHAENIIGRGLFVAARDIETSAELLAAVVDAESFIRQYVESDAATTMGDCLRAAIAKANGDADQAGHAFTLPVRPATPEAAAAAAKLGAPGHCGCTADGRHLCAMCGARLGEVRPAEPDADGQVRPCGARLVDECDTDGASLWSCSICGETYLTAADARECCSGDDVRDQT